MSQENVEIVRRVVEVNRQEHFEDLSVELERLIDAGDDGVVGLFRQTATGKGTACQSNSKWP